MRIAIVNWTDRMAGGIEEYVSLLLEPLLRSGHEVAFWHELEVPADRAPFDIPGSVAVISASRLGFDEAMRQLRRWNPDVLYVHGLSNLDHERALLDVAPAVAFIHSYVGTCISGNKTHTRPGVVPCSRRFSSACLAHYFPRGCGGRSPVTMWRRFQDQKARLTLLRRYTAVLTHSAHMRAEMAAHEIASSVVVYAIRPSSLESLPVWAPEERCRLVFAGRIEFLKGGELLLSALPDVAAGLNRPVHLAIMGDGRDRTVWEQKARAIASGSNISVEFTGWLPAPVLSQRLATADLLVVPSLWPEPFGSIGPFAGLHGIPAAGFASGGIAEWLHDGVNGHLADSHPPRASSLSEAIVKCLRDDARYRAMRDAAREIGARFSIANHLSALLPALERAAAMPAGAASSSR